MSVFFRIIKLAKLPTYMTVVLIASSSVGFSKMLFSMIKSVVSVAK